MTTSFVGPLPNSSQVINQQGLITPEWSKWFNQLYLRSGGPSAINLSDFIGQTATIKALVEGTYATAADATIYTAPAATTTVLEKVTVTNQDASTAYTLNVNIVPSAGAAGPTNLIINTKSIATGTAVDLSDILNNQTLNTGDFISIKASVANKLVVRVSGLEFT